MGIEPTSEAWEPWRRRTLPGIKFDRRVVASTRVRPSDSVTLTPATCWINVLKPLVLFEDVPKPLVLKSYLRLTGQLGVMLADYRVHRIL
jgi:hypothetical protein